MARNIRLLSKKRGDRHTGSPVVGGLGEALFFGALFLLGSVSLAYLIASRFVTVAAAPYEPGFGFWLMIIATTSLTLLGGGGVIYTVLNLETSAERRSAMVRRATAIDFRGDAVRPERAYPTLPSDTNIINSPGVRLPYRLPVVQGSVWALFAAAVFFLVCSGVTIALITVALKAHLAGLPDWPLTLLATVFLVLCCWAIYYFVKQLVLQTGIGPTSVEISDHPLNPGGFYQYYVCQSGRLMVRKLTISLVCQEETTYQQGTDICSDQCPVFVQDVLVRSEFPIQPGNPFEHEATIAIPNNAMHSFQTSHNTIRWMLIVRCDAYKRPPFERRFPVVVYPTRSELELDRWSH